MDKKIIVWIVVLVVFGSLVFGDDVEIIAASDYDIGYTVTLAEGTYATFVYGGSTYYVKYNSDTGTADLSTVYDSNGERVGYFNSDYSVTLSENPSGWGSSAETISVGTSSTNTIDTYTLSIDGEEEYTFGNGDIITFTDEVAWWWDTSESYIYQNGKWYEYNPETKEYGSVVNAQTVYDAINVGSGADQVTVTYSYGESETHELENTDSFDLSASGGVESDSVMVDFSTGNYFEGDYLFDDYTVKNTVDIGGNSYAELESGGEIYYAPYDENGNIDTDVVYDSTGSLAGYINDDTNRIVLDSEHETEYADSISISSGDDDSGMTMEDDEEEDVEDDDYEYDDDLDDDSALAGSSSAGAGTDDDGDGDQFGEGEEEVHDPFGSYGLSDDEDEGTIVVDTTIPITDSSTEADIDNAGFTRGTTDTFGDTTWTKTIDGVTYTVYTNKEGEVVDMNEDGRSKDEIEVPQGIDEDAPTTTIPTPTEQNSFYSALDSVEYHTDEFAGLGGLSSLFWEDETNEWAQEVDEFFCDTVILGGIDCCVSKICESYYPRVGSEDVIIVTPSGMTFPIAHVEGERSEAITYLNVTEEETDEGVVEEVEEVTEYLYKFTYVVSNPEDSDMDIKFNIYLYGSNIEAKVYSEDQKVDDGDAFERKGASAFIQYSEKLYTTICIYFSEGLSGASCNAIVEAEGDAITYSVTEDGTDGSGITDGSDTSSGTWEGEADI